MAGRDAAAAARRAGLIVLAALALTGAAPAPRTSLPDIEDEVMCAQCGTPLALSDSDVAEEERRFIRRLIAQGKTKDEIKDALVEEYGPGVLALPEDDGFGLAVYIVPPLALLLAGGGIAIAARRWRARPAPEAATDPEDDVSREDSERLERDMATYDL